jgi:hypothetical protein
MLVTDLFERAPETAEQAPHLYLDMDGVQADFFTQWARWHNQKFGQSHVERYKDIGSKEQREQSIGELSAEGPEFIERFFATLPTLPGGMRLVRWLRQNRIPFTVLSAPLRGMHEPSIAGKRTWLDQHNPGTSADAIFTGRKESYATRGGRPNILIDDHKKWVQNWIDAGGIGIVYRDNRVADVIQELAKIYGVGMTESQDFQSHGARLKNYIVTLKITQGSTYQRMDTTVTARSPEQAKRLIQQQYGRNIVVGRPRELK